MIHFFRDHEVLDKSLKYVLLVQGNQGTKTQAVIWESRKEAQGKQ